MRMEVYAERDRFNRMLQTSMHGGLSSSIQKGLRDYLLAEDPSLRNHVTRMRENLDACRVTRQELASADQKCKTIPGVFTSGYGMFEAAFHGTRLRVVGLRRNVDAARTEHVRCKADLLRAQRLERDFERSHGEINKELEIRQRAYNEAEALWHRCRQAREIAMEIERKGSLRSEAEKGLEQATTALRTVEQRFRQAEGKRDRLLAETVRSAEGMADAQKAWEQVSRKVTLYKHAIGALDGVRKTFPDREVTDRGAEAIQSECRDRWSRALDDKTQVERELESLEARILRYERVLEALRAASKEDFVPMQALEIVRGLDRARIEQQMERLLAEAVEWREAHRLVQTLEDGFGTPIADGPVLDDL